MMIKSSIFSTFKLLNLQNPAIGRTTLYIPKPFQIKKIILKVNLGYYFIMYKNEFDNYLKQKIKDLNPYLFYGQSIF